MKKDNQGQQYSGDASFGPPDPVDPDGRAERSDFYDYLGLPWSFLDGKAALPDPSASWPWTAPATCGWSTVTGSAIRCAARTHPGEGLPRRAYAMAEFGPGVQLMPNSGQRARGMDRLLPGDLVFFNAQPVPSGQIDHSGIYLGVDDGGHHRFISSRSQTDGPTMGDLSGAPLLDGIGYWPDRWLTARRL